MVIHSKYETIRNMISRFKVFSRIAVIVLVLSHSIVSLERLFSVIGKNKIDMRSSLKLDGTLSSIISIKTHNPESRTLCFKWRPDQDFLELSRKAAKAYNDEHKSQLLSKFWLLVFFRIEVESRCIIQQPKLVRMNLSKLY